MTTPQNDGMYNSLLNNTQFINAVNIADFLLNLQNMNLNITADDLENHTKTILEEINRHLSSQDEHLLSQDRHLREQDKRLDRLEKLFYWRGYDE